MRIVVLEADLQLNRLGKLALLGLLRILEDLANTLVECFLRNLACPGNKTNGKVKSKPI